MMYDIIGAERYVTQSGYPGSACGMVGGRAFKIQKNAAIFKRMSGCLQVVAKVACIINRAEQEITIVRARRLEKSAKSKDGFGSHSWRGGTNPHVDASGVCTCGLGKR